MHRQTLGSGDDLAVVLGWGNRLDHENVRWLLDRLAEEYRVHAFRIPDAVTDFERQYVRPIERYVAELGEWRLLGHSTGGLIGPFVAESTDIEPTTRTYLSPWWDNPPERKGRCTTPSRGCRSLARSCRPASTTENCSAT